MIAICRRKIRFEDSERVNRRNDGISKKNSRERQEKEKFFSVTETMKLRIGQIDEFFHYSFLSAYDFSRLMRQGRGQRGFFPRNRDQSCFEPGMEITSVM